jgi:hypothetical protein
MHPSFILNTNATADDLAEVTSELLDKSKTLMSMILYSCFDEEGNMIAPKKMVADSLWIAAEFVGDAKEAHDQSRNAGSSN